MQEDYYYLQLAALEKKSKTLTNIAWLEPELFPETYGIVVYKINREKHELNITPTKEEFAKPKYIIMRFIGNSEKNILNEIDRACRLKLENLPILDFQQNQISTSHFTYFQEVEEMLYEIENVFTKTTNYIKKNADTINDDSTMLQNLHVTNSNQILEKLELYKLLIEGFEKEKNELKQEKILKTVKDVKNYTDKINNFTAKLINYTAYFEDDFKEIVSKKNKPKQELNLNQNHVDVSVKIESLLSSIKKLKRNLEFVENKFIKAFEEGLNIASFNNKKYSHFPSKNEILTQKINIVRGKLKNCITQLTSQSIEIPKTIETIEKLNRLKQTQENYDKLQFEELKLEKWKKNLNKVNDYINIYDNMVDNLRTKSKFNNIQNQQSKPPTEIKKHFQTDKQTDKQTYAACRNK